VAIGRNITASSRYFDGLIDEVRVSSTARSANWITTSYNNQNAPATYLTFGSAEADNTAPQATFDNDLSTWQGGDITINYNLIDDDSDTLNISHTATSGIEYSTDNSTWYDATETSGAPSEGLTSLAGVTSPGTDHIFVWDSSTDLGSTQDSTVYLRLRPNDGTESASAWVTSNSFGIDNVAPSSINAPTFGTLTDTTIVITKPTTVTEGGSGLNTWQPRRDTATNLTAEAVGTTQITDSSLSNNTQYTYDVRFTDNASNSSTYGTTAQTYTLAPTPTTLTATSARNSLTLTTTAFNNDTTSSSGYYFTNTTKGTTSGWIQTNSYLEETLNCATNYDYTVKLRNADGTQTSTKSATLTTAICIGGAIPPAARNNPWNNIQPTGADSPNQNNEQSETNSLRININDNNPTTNSRYVTLTLKADTHTKRMAISNTQDFTGATQIPFTNTTTNSTTPKAIVDNWDLCSTGNNQTHPTDCQAGQQTVYVKFYTRYGQSSPTVTDTIDYDSETKNSTQNPTQHSGETGAQTTDTESSTKKISSTDQKESTTNQTVELKEGTLTKELNHPAVYLIEDGKKRPIFNANIFKSYNYSWDDIIEVKSLDNYPTGEMIKEKQTETTKETKTIKKEQTEIINKDNLPSAKFTHPLYLGMISKAVRRLQTLLTTMPNIYPQGYITGYFGKLTKKAVQKFQEQYNLATPQDPGYGYVGPKTRGKLFEVFGR